MRYFACIIPCFPMDPFVNQLAELCRAHVTRAKWVFVPSHALGWTLGERIALSGTNWLNLRFVTPLDIALQMGAPFLVERGVLSGGSVSSKGRSEERRVGKDCRSGWQP